jgi:hypothetical protein
MDERLDTRMDSWVDDPADNEAALPATDDTVALADLDF